MSTCTIHEHACEGTVNWSTSYQATSSEPNSGKVATSDQNSGGNDAAEQATWRLSTQLGLSSSNVWDCNCQSKIYNQALVI